jgi:hypothetical protein
MGLESYGHNRHNRAPAATISNCGSPPPAKAAQRTWFIMGDGQEGLLFEPKLKKKKCSGCGGSGIGVETSACETCGGGGSVDSVAWSGLFYWPLALLACIAAFFISALLTGPLGVYAVIPAIVAFVAILWWAGRIEERRLEQAKSAAPRYGQSDNPRFITDSVKTIISPDGDPAIFWEYSGNVYPESYPRACPCCAEPQPSSLGPTIKLDKDKIEGYKVPGGSIKVYVDGQFAGFEYVNGSSVPPLTARKLLPLCDICEKHVDLATKVPAFGCVVLGVLVATWYADLKLSYWIESQANTPVDFFLLVGWVISTIAVSIGLWLFKRRWARARISRGLNLMKPSCSRLKEPVRFLRYSKTKVAVHATNTAWVQAVGRENRVWATTRFAPIEFVPMDYAVYKSELKRYKRRWQRIGLAAGGAIIGLAALKSAPAPRINATTSKQATRISQTTANGFIVYKILVYPGEWSPPLTVPPAVSSVDANTTEDAEIKTELNGVVIGQQRTLPAPGSIYRFMVTSHKPAQVVIRFGTGKRKSGSLKNQ